MNACISRFYAKHKIDPCRQNENPLILCFLAFQAIVNSPLSETKKQFQIQAWLEVIKRKWSKNKCLSSFIHENSRGRRFGIVCLDLTRNTTACRLAENKQPAVNIAYLEDSPDFYIGYDSHLDQQHLIVINGGKNPCYLAIGNKYVKIHGGCDEAEVSYIDKKEYQDFIHAPIPPRITNFNVTKGTKNKAILQRKI